MMITGSIGGGNKKKVQEAIKRFKNERFPSIAVTVDLLTTGIDVPEITTLVFMRCVKSRILNPVVVNPTTTFTQLLEGLEVLEDEKQVLNQINQIVARLQRKKRNMDSETMEHFISMTGGQDPTQFIIDIQHREPQDAKKRLLHYVDMFGMLQQNNANSGHPVVISDPEDELLEHSRGYGKGSSPEDYLDAFAIYVKSNLNEIASGSIYRSGTGT